MNTCWFCGHNVEHSNHATDAPCDAQCKCRCQWGTCNGCDRQGRGYPKSKFGSQWWQPAEAVLKATATKPSFWCVHCLFDAEIACCRKCGEVDYAVRHPATEEIVCLDCFERDVEKVLYESTCENDSSSSTCYHFTLVDGEPYHVHVRSMRPCRRNDSCLHLIDEFDNKLAERYVEHNVPHYLSDECDVDISVTKSAPNVLQRLLWRTLEW